MSDIDQKIPFAQSLNFFTDRKIADAIQSVGQSYPCHVISVTGSIVKVAFDIAVPNNITLPQVTCPVFGPEYIRYPIKAGDRGVCFAASVNLKEVTGLGTGLPDFNLPGNLSALVFFPIGNVNWVQVDPEAVVIYAPNGVVLKTDSNSSNITLNKDSITLSSKTITSAASGTNNVNGTLVKLGQAAALSAAAMSGGGSALLSSTMSSGPSAIYSNPATTNITALSSTISGGSIQSGLSTLVTAGTITTLQRTNIISSLDSITTSTTNLIAHTNLISGLGTVTSNAPNLNGIIGMSLSAQSMGGIFGSSSTLIAGMTTALTSSSVLASATTYCNGIIAGLTALSLTPAAVISTNLANASAVQGFVNTDTAAYLDLQGKLSSASVFLKGIGNAKSTDAGVSGLISQVSPPATLTTLQSV